MGRTETSSANVRITPMMTRPAIAKARTHPAEPERPISSPDVTKRPTPTVPLKAIAVGACVSTWRKHRLVGYSDK